MRTEGVSTDQLRTGDLVLNYGMRIRLTAREVYQSWSSPRWGEDGSTVYRFDGHVENADEIHALGRDHVTSGLLRGSYWAVQGNDLASWTRVVSE